MNNKYALKWLYVSVGIAVLQYIISQYVSWFSTLLWGIILFIPAIFVYIIYLISLKTVEKFPKPTKFITNFLNFAIVIIIQFIIIGFLSLVISWSFWWDTSNVRLYHQALVRTYKKERVTHFPRRIPVTKDKVIFHHEEHPWFGSGEIILSFKADKEYIDKELAKYKFVKIEGPYDEVQKYDYAVRYLGIGYPEFQIKNTKNYIIGYSGKPGTYGILIDEINNRVTYYFTAPD